MNDFLKAQGWIIAGILVIGFVRLLMQKRQSHFRDDVADQLRSDVHKAKSNADLAGAKINRTPPQQLLTGLSIQGKPHEILGISSNASEVEIQKAFKDLIKRYHPDQVGRPGTREWKEAQALAQAITDARNKMLELVQK